MKSRFGKCLAADASIVKVNSSHGMSWSYDEVCFATSDAEQY